MLKWQLSAQLLDQARVVIRYTQDFKKILYLCDFMMIGNQNQMRSFRGQDGSEQNVMIDVMQINLHKSVKNYVNIIYFISDKDERGRSLSGPSKYISIENIDCSKSICSADVVLISSLSEGKTYK